MKAKKIIIWIVVAFAVYTVITAPDEAADLVREAFNTLADGGRSVGRFFDQIVT